MKDVVDKGEVNIGYCPTHEMLAYFFIKYLQGRLFYKFREYVMGYKHITTLLRGTFSIKKHFGDQKLIILKKNINSKREKDIPAVRTRKRQSGEQI